LRNLAVGSKADQSRFVHAFEMAHCEAILMAFNAWRKKI
tara:strand:- start:5242 stop:5358 length:117 start_codon:yes stop_codon:yes gene_type:complete